MRVSGKLLILLVATAIPGVAFSTISVSEDVQAPAPVAIPVMRVGEGFVYAIFDQDGTGSWEPSGRAAFKVGAVTEALDHRGRLTPVVELRAAGADTPIHQYVALSDRLVVRTTVQLDLGEHMVTDLVRDIPALPGVALQGRELRLGDEIEVPVLYLGTGRGGSMGTNQQRFLDGSSMLIFGQLQAYPELQPSAPVMAVATATDTGKLDGRPVIGVNWTTVRHFEVELADEIDGQWSVHDATATTWTVAWWRDGMAAPVSVELTYHTEYDDGTVTTGRSSWLLVEHEAGTTPLPWGAASPPDPAFEKAPSVGRRPADGAGSILPYPLSEALGDVSGTPLDLGWLHWRQFHPDAELVGALMVRGSGATASDPSVEWRLVFSDGGSAYEVRTERWTKRPASQVEGMGTTGLPDFDADPPEEQITFAEAVRLWQEEFGHDDTTVPTWIHWGVGPGSWRMSRTCLSFQEKDIRAPTSELDALTIQVGLTPTGPCDNDDEIYVFEALFLRAANPTLVGTMTVERSADAFRGGPPIARDGTYAGVAEGSKSTHYAFVSPSPLKTTILTAPLLMVGLMAYFFPALKFATTQGLLFIPGFSRLKRDRLLDQGQRDRLHVLIEKNPGASVSELAKGADLAWGTTVHHLTVMEKNGLVGSCVEGRHRRFFLLEAFPHADRPKAALLANAHTERFYAALVEEPGLAAGELAHRLGVTPPGAYYQLQRLHESGLVERRREGRYVRYFPTGLTPRPHDPKEAVEVA